MSKPKVLVFDIETSPMLGHVWSLWEQNVALNQLHADWHVMAWAAKWLGDSPNKIMYQDQRKAKDVQDDRKLLQGIWKLLDEADVVITQNGKSFDVKKLNARFIMSGMQPPSSFRHIDTKILAKKHFAFTSNRLEYMTDKLCTKYKKIKTSKYGGFELWKACLAGDKAAWAHMEKYNKYDVLSLEELYTKLAPWDHSVNFNLYSNSEEHVCNCGSTETKRNGYKFTAVGKYQRYKCLECGAESRSRENLLTDTKRASLRAVSR
jgi:DNA polymerase elongation subunit (family B)